MRRAAALAAITMLACAGASGQTTGPDGSDPCTRLGDLAATMDCLAAVDTPRPYDGVERCAGLDPGQFKRPVQGKLILRYGEKTQFGSTSRGVVIETGSAGQVVAPIDSVVLYAGEFRSYGKLLILEPGCGLRVLIAGMDTTDVQRGQLVQAGESLATMASRGGSDAPVLYIELRRNGQTVDPGAGIAGP